METFLAAFLTIFLAVCLIIFTGLALVVAKDCIDSFRMRRIHKKVVTSYMTRYDTTYEEADEAINHYCDNHFKQ